MGHRCLVAYDRDGYDLHYAHWGVEAATITPETPFGRRPDAPTVARDILPGIEPVGGRLTGGHRTPVDPDPVATGLSFEGVCERLDPIEHEALYVVDVDFSVRSYLVLALDREGGGPRLALAGHRNVVDAGYLRGWLAGARAIRHVVGTEPAVVARALRWLDADRGVVVYPARSRTGDGA